MPKSELDLNVNENLISRLDGKEFTVGDELGWMRSQIKMIEVEDLVDLIFFANDPVMPQLVGGDISFISFVGIILGLFV